MLGFAHEDTLSVLKHFHKSPDHRIYALTNWSGELWPRAIAKFDWLKWFEGILVSGAEGMRKPFPEIYELILSRYNIDREKAVFIDDSIKNVEGSEAVGLKALHFEGAAKLTDDLRKLGVL